MKSWKRVSIGGATAIMAGTASAHSYAHINTETPESEAIKAPGATSSELNAQHSTFNPQPSDPEPNFVEKAENVITVPEVSVAHNVNDSMTFGQAFAAARAEIGPGGIFEWRGHVYNTYYAEEWDAMTHEQHNMLAQQTQTVIVETPEPPIEPVSPTPADDGIIVLGTEVIDFEGITMTATSLHIEGTQAVLLDVDQDGIYDALAVDANANGDLDEGELIDIHDQGHTVAEVTGQDINFGEPDPNIYTTCGDAGENLGMQTDNLAYDMPDYVNDADTLV